LFTRKSRATPRRLRARRRKGRALLRLKSFRERPMLVF
ncbi:hypothetical protein CI238_13630, partial [Colletotrichum incanum]